MKKMTRILSILLIFCLLVSLVPPGVNAVTLKFTDVSPASWYYDAVAYVYENKIMTGTAADRFSPGTTVTRGQMCQILYNLEGQPQSGGKSFSDVKSGDWFYAAVTWAASKDIVSGMGDGTFAPTKPITREQMVLILYRYAQYKGYDVDSGISLSNYADIGSVSTWALEAMQWAVGEGYVSGTTATTLGPGGTATRAQIATILMRFCEKTEAYLAFKAKDIKDFPGYEIINFDSSNETNFAVLTKDTIAIKPNGTANQLISANEDTGTYIFDNIGAEISGLSAGDILYHDGGSDEDDYVLLKVGAVDISGTRATVTAVDADLTEFFEYIDVDMDIGIGAEDIDTSTASAGVTVRALDESTNEEVTYLRNKEDSGTGKSAFKLTIGGENLNISGEDKITATVKVSHSGFAGLDFHKFRFTVKQELSITAKVGEKFKAKPGEEFSLGKASVPIGGGFSFDVELKPVFDFSLSGDLSAKYTITTEQGFQYDFDTKTNEKIDKSDLGKSEINITGKFSFSVGIRLETSIRWLILSAGLEGEAGIKVEGKDSISVFGADESKRHTCKVCIDGEIDLYAKLSFKLKVTKKWTPVDVTLAEVTVKFKDFYISWPSVNGKLEFGWGDCPHMEYLVTVKVIDQNNEAVADALVSIVNASNDATIGSGNTDGNGVFSVYCGNGEYEVSVFGLDGYAQEAKTKDFVLSGKKQNVTITLEKNEDNLSENTQLPEADISTFSEWGIMPNFVRYNEFTLGGRPICKLSNDELYNHFRSIATDSRDDWAETIFYLNNSMIAEVPFDDTADPIGVVYYPGYLFEESGSYKEFNTGWRNIHMGENLASVLTKLGFSKEGVQYLISHRSDQLFNEWDITVDSNGKVSISIEQYEATNGYGDISFQDEVIMGIYFLKLDSEYSSAGFSFSNNDELNLCSFSEVT